MRETEKEREIRNRSLSLILPFHASPALPLVMAAKAVRFQGERATAVMRNRRGERERERALKRSEIESPYTVSGPVFPLPQSGRNGGGACNDYTRRRKRPFLPSFFACGYFLPLSPFLPSPHSEFQSGLPNRAVNNVGRR